ncbi:hypothetical protein [Thalassospira sp.]|uniref:hypothetical protein n=1 Tax=Thalassospira sp. TaxID=1912094 RepID=UPI00311F34AA
MLVSIVGVCRHQKVDLGKRTKVFGQRHSVWKKAKGKKVVKLNREEVLFLQSELQINEHLKNVLKLAAQGQELSQKDADSLREHCIERLDVDGFDKEYQPTILIGKLELLIDKLFVG